MATTPPSARKRWLHRIAALTLLAVSLELMTGCFYIPTLGRVEKSRRSEDFERPSQIGKLVKVGETSRARIEKSLGRGDQTQQNVYTYRWDVRQGYWIYPLCFTGYPSSRTIIARLAFDDQDILQGFEVLNGYSGPNNIIVRSGTVPPLIPKSPATLPMRQLP